MKRSGKIRWKKGLQGRGEGREREEDDVRKEEKVSGEKGGRM